LTIGEADFYPLLQRLQEQAEQIDND